MSKTPEVETPRRGDAKRPPSPERGDGRGEGATRQRRHYACCYRSGEIEIRATVPDGAVAIAFGPKDVLIDRMTVVARHGYDGETLLVPGVPEASDEKAAIAALERFATWIKPRCEAAGLTMTL